MTALPYTHADLRAEAARQHHTLIADPDFMGTGEMMQDSAVASLAPRPTAEDIDGQPNKAGITWMQLLPLEADGCEAYDLAQNRIHDLINGAADTSAWAVSLGVDGLEPSPDTCDVQGDDRPLVRIHFAFDKNMPADARTEFITAACAAIANSF